MNDRYSAIKAKAKIFNARTRKIRDSVAYERVVGVLSGLGFLVAPDVKPTPNAKIEFETALKLGITIEPRILEVLPAAVLSFPKSFLHLEKAPDDFMQIVAALKSGRSGPDLHGISFKKLFEAANRPTKDRRRKIVTERRMSKTFRLYPSTVEILSRRASESGMDRTEYLESLIQRDGKILEERT